MPFGKLAVAERCLYHQQRGASSRDEIDNVAMSCANWLRDEIGTAQEKQIYREYLIWCGALVVDGYLKSTSKGSVKREITPPARVRKPIIRHYTKTDYVDSGPLIQLALTKTRIDIHIASGSPIAIRHWLSNRFGAWKHLVRFAGTSMSDMDNVIFDEWLIDYVQSTFVDTFYPDSTSDRDSGADDDGELSIGDQAEWDSMYHRTPTSQPARKKKGYK